MSTRVAAELDYSIYPASDGEPMAETIENQIQMIELQYDLRYLFERQGRTQWAVGGNQFMYYTEGNRNDHVSPDVYAALDVPPRLRARWFTWIEGKFPDIVFEITSESTAQIDLRDKPNLYARLGAREYYIYDPQGRMRPGLLAYHLVHGRMEPLPTLTATSVTSPLLRCEFRVVGQYLRWIDPEPDAPLPPIGDERRLRLLAEAGLTAEEAARRLAEQRAREAEESRRVAETCARAEAAARKAAEAQVRRTQEAREAAEQRAREVEQRLAELEGRMRQRPGEQERPDDR